MRKNRLRSFLRKQKGKGKMLIVCGLAGAVFFADGSLAHAATLADVFDAKQYADIYADLKEAFGYDEEALLNHYLTYGIAEGRSSGGLLDVVKYREAYPDLDAAFGDNWDAYVNHFLTFGFAEKRDNFTDFDAEAYAERYVDLQEAFGEDVLALYKHYEEVGREEGRDAEEEVVVIEEEPEEEEPEEEEPGEEKPGEEKPGEEEPGEEEPGEEKPGEEEPGEEKPGEEEPGEEKPGEEEPGEEKPGEEEPGEEKPGEEEPGEEKPGEEEPGEEKPGEGEPGEEKPGEEKPGEEEPGEEEPGEEKPGEEKPEEGKTTEEHYEDGSWVKQEYNADDQLIKSTFYSADNEITGWQNYEYLNQGDTVKVAQYDAERILLRVAEYDKDDQSTPRMERKYKDGKCDEVRMDEIGRIIGSAYYEYDGNPSEDPSQMTFLYSVDVTYYQYYPDCDLVKENTYHYADGNEKIVRYDGYGEIQWEKYISYYSDGSGYQEKWYEEGYCNHIAEYEKVGDEYFCKETFGYNRDGDLVGHTINEQLEQSGWRRSKSYDAEGIITGITEFDENNQPRMDRKYSNGECEEVRFGEDWRVLSHAIYEYEGIPSEDLSQLTFVELYEYEYDDDPHLVQRFIHHFADGTYEIGEYDADRNYEVKLYDKSGNLLSTKKYDSDRNEIV